MRCCGSPVSRRRKSPPAHAWAALLEQLAAQRRVTRLVSGATQLWITAERLPLFTALFPQAQCTPSVVTPAAHTGTPAAQAALVEVVRGRLEGSGPVSAARLAETLGLPLAQLDAALAALQAEGFALRGAFSAGAAPGSEWCERRLLARIHRYTVKRLRAEIEPIAARDFLRFLFAWQRVTPAGAHGGTGCGRRGAGAAGGLRVPGERLGDRDPARSASASTSRRGSMSSAWPDASCGRASHRGAPTRERGAAPVRATPIVLLARRNVRLWGTLTSATDPGHLSAPAQRVAQYLLDPRRLVLR